MNSTAPSTGPKTETKGMMNFATRRDISSGWLMASVFGKTSAKTSSSAVMMIVA